MLHNVAVLVSGRDGAFRARCARARCGASPTTPTTAFRCSTSGSARPGPVSSPGGPTSTSWSSTTCRPRPTRTWCAWRRSAKFEDHDPAVLEAMRAAYDRGAIISPTAPARSRWARPACSTAGSARRTGVHRPAGRRVPRRQGRPEVLYADEGNVLTGAGSAAGLDASLTSGARSTAPTSPRIVARRIVVPPHRDGGQAQFIARQVVRLRRRDPRPAAHLDPREPRRGPQRRLPRPPGTHVTPHVRPPVPRRDRHHPAQLGDRPAGRRRPRSCSSAPTRPVDWIAAEVGFGNAAALRHHFTARARASARSSTGVMFCPASRRPPDELSSLRDLAGQGARQLVVEDVGLGRFGGARCSRRTPCSASSVDLARPRPRRPAGPTRRRDAVHGDVDDARVLAEDLLDLERVDVDAAADDQVLAPAVEVEVAVLVEPAVVADGERRSCSRQAAAGLLRVAEVGEPGVLGDRAPDRAVRRRRSASGRAGRGRRCRAAVSHSSLRQAVN